MRRPGSSAFQLRKRIPADVIHKVRGRTVSIPIGEQLVQVLIGPKAEAVITSLRTTDPKEAEARQAAALAYLDKYRASVRSGPRTLTTKEVVALAGEHYREIAEEIEDEPGPPEVWETLVAQQNVQRRLKAKAQGVVRGP